MGDTDINVNISNTQTTYTTADTETPPPGQIGQSTIDTTGVADQNQETQVPQDTGNPQVKQPNDTTINTPPPPSETTDPVGMEQKIREQIETDPELADAFNAILKRRGNDTEEGRKELLSSLAKQASEAGGDDSRAIKEAMASQLQGLINSSSLQDAQELQPLLNQLRMSLFSQDVPTTEVLEYFLEEQFIAKGKSPEEAKQLAQAKALELIDDYLSKNGVTTPLFGTHPLEETAINEALLASLPEELQGIEGEGLVGGISMTLDISKMIEDYFVQLSNITPPEGAEAVNFQERVKIASQGLDSLNEAIKAMQDSLGDLPLTGEERIQLREYLKFLSDTIKQLKDLLDKIAILDAEKSKKLSQMEIELADTRFKAQMELLKNQLEQYMKQVAMKEKMKIISYVVGALLAIFGALLTPFTGGASLALAIAVSVAIFAVTVALSETGVLNKAFKALGAALDKAIQSMSPDAPSWAKSLFKVFVYAVIIIASVLITKGVNVALKAIASPLAQILAIQVGITLTTQLIASSGVINDFVKATFANIPGISKEAIAGISAALLIILLVGVSLGGAVAISKLAKDLTDSASKFGKDIFDKLLKLGVDPKKLSLQDCINAASTIRSYAAYISVGASILQAGPAIVNGITAQQIAKLKEQEAEFEALIETINELIKLLKKMVDILQGDVSATLDQKGDLTKLFENAVSGLRDAVTNLTNAA